MPDHEPEFYTDEEVMLLFRIPRDDLREAFITGEIPAIRIAGHWRVHRSVLHGKIAEACGEPNSAVYIPKASDPLGKLIEQGVGRRRIAAVLGVSEHHARKMIEERTTDFEPSYNEEDPRQGPGRGSGDAQRLTRATL